VDGVAAHLGLLWEEDGTEENILDEGYITFGATETIPFYATAGKMYLPFGNFESAFISDPLTLEMAEINESAALAGFGNEWVDVNAGGFNGSNDNTIENGFAALSFTLSETVVFGAYWISNILETDGFDDDSFVPVSAMNDVGGAGAFVNAQIGIVSLNAEYVTALEKIEGTGLTPNSYNIEVSMPIGETLSAGMKFEGSDDFFAAVGGDRFANWQTGFVVSCEFNEHVILSGEYLHADGLDNDESGDTATMQIALVF
ncbi:MAG: LbtU family siderophore porin, partial [Verrucomicrobiota bacterium]